MRWHEPPIKGRGARIVEAVNSSGNRVKANAGATPALVIAKNLGVSRATFYRYIEFTRTDTGSGVSAYNLVRAPKTFYSRNEA